MWEEKLHWGIGQGGNSYKEKETIRSEKSVKSKTFLVQGKCNKKILKRGEKMEKALGLVQLADDDKHLKVSLIIWI